MAPFSAFDPQPTLSHYHECMKTTTRFASLLLASILPLSTESGCAGTRQRAHSSTTAVDPCALLTPAEVAHALREPFVRVTRIDATHCMYKGKTVLSTIIVEASADGADGLFSGGRLAQNLMGDTGEPAIRIGDASFWTALGNVLYVRKGNGYIGIDMRGAGVRTRVVGPELARVALSRMP